MDLEIFIFDNEKFITEEPKRYHIGMHSVLTDIISFHDRSYIRVKKESLDHLIRRIFQVGENDITVITDKLSREKINSLVKIGVAFKTIHTLDSICEYGNNIFMILNFIENDIEAFVDIQNFKDFRGNSLQYREMFDSIFSIPELVDRSKLILRDVW